VTSTRRAAPLLLAVLVGLIAGCGAGAPMRSISVASISESAAAASGSAAAAPNSAARSPGTHTARARERTILLNPGHNGGNSAHPEAMAKQVPDGRGGTKACDTSGTSTDAGYPEHAFNWDVALRVRGLLNANGINVVLSRDNDTGVGPCVDVRGELAARVNADAAVSIHADGASPGGHGFHVAYPNPARNAAQGAPSVAMATELRDALRGAGLSISTYLGQDGLAPRADLAGLNLSQRPAALVECANMRNAQEAATVSNPTGRQLYAQAITNGILNWLAHNPPSAY